MKIENLRIFESENFKNLKKFENLRITKSLKILKFPKVNSLKVSQNAQNEENCTKTERIAPKRVNLGKIHKNTPNVQTCGSWKKS